MLTDLNLLRGISTVLAFASFIGIALWAWSGRNRSRFDEAAALVLDDEPTHQPAQEKSI